MDGRTDGTEFIGPLSALLGVQKVIKRKGDKLYVKWKGYNNSFNSWIDQKDNINE